jgi:hypothetical protein
MVPEPSVQEALAVIYLNQHSNISTSRGWASTGFHVGVFLHSKTAIVMSYAYPRAHKWLHYRLREKQYRDAWFRLYFIPYTSCILMHSS